MYAVIIRYSEIATKGKNRSQFENVLIDNIKQFLRKEGFSDFTIIRPRGRIIILSSQQINASFEYIFGISSYSYSKQILQEMDLIRKAVEEKTALWGEKITFRVSVQRIDKAYPIASMELSRQIGSYICEKTGLSVSLEKYDKEISIELVDGYAYVFDTRIIGMGGLPMGIQGNAYSLIEDEDSLLAAILVMKRGCSIVPIAFSGFDISVFKRYGLEASLELISSYSDLDKSISSIIVNDRFGSIRKQDSIRMILRPLVGFDDKEIEDLKEAYLR